MIYNYLVGKNLMKFVSNILLRRILVSARHIQSAKMAIKSYVFFDLETTGLPHLEFGETKITELTMLAVVKEHIGAPTDSRPRIINKLTVTLNPMKYISPDGAIVTGLTNELLDDFQPFNEETAQMLITFLSRIPQPACLLAHNGDRFDFPILKSHLSRQKKEFPDNILCADTLKCFRELSVMENDYFHQEKKNPDEWDDDFCPEELHKVMESVDNQVNLAHNQSSAMTQPNPPSTPTKPHRNYSSQSSSGPSNGYKTPEKSKISVKKLHELTGKNKSSQDVRKELTPQKPSSQGNSSKQVSKRLFRPSYTLSSVHLHVTGLQLANAHSSECDCLALLDIVKILGTPFHDWVSFNAIPFTSFHRS